MLVKEFRESDFNDIEYVLVKVPEVLAGQKGAFELKPTKDVDLKNHIVVRYVDEVDIGYEKGSMGGTYYLVPFNLLSDMDIKTCIHDFSEMRANIIEGVIPMINKHAFFLYNKIKEV